ncbi:MAG: DUF503 domain-containing protein [Chloroflexota bacterium]|nr:DUF503 domain-containing protein [Chloroflexota bacterium]
MSHAIVGLFTFELHLPGAESLKDKRSRLKSMLSRLHNTFNVSAAEVDHQDIWQSAVIAVGVVTNSTKHAHEVISSVVKWIEKHYPDLEIVNEATEIL